MYIYLYNKQVFVQQKEICLYLYFSHTPLKLIVCCHKVKVYVNIHTYIHTFEYCCR